jgi:hypothetical protein
VSALIKGVIDSVRELPGYAGMAVYFARGCIYVDILDSLLADGMYDLFSGPQCDEDIPVARTFTAIIRGYSVLAFSAGDVAVVARFEGRYFHMPKIYPVEDDIVPAEPAPRLMSKEEARREARELLKSFNILPHG